MVVPPFQRILDGETSPEVGRVAPRRGGRGPLKGEASSSASTRNCLDAKRSRREAKRRVATHLDLKRRTRPAFFFVEEYSSRLLKGGEAFTTSHGVAITPRNSWFHRYEPVIEKAFARLWGERPKLLFPPVGWSFRLQLWNRVVAL